MNNSQQERFTEFKLKEQQKINQEGIIDKFIVKYIAFNVLLLLENANITPNMVTTLSLITSCFSISYIYYDKYIFGSILFLFRYILDCIDGPLARYTKTVSKFGDIYDHLVDLITFISFFIVTLTKNFSNLFYTGIIILLITSAIHHIIISKQQTHQSQLISSILQNIPINLNKLYWTKYLSTDIAVLYVCIGMIIEQIFM
jgi:phosphatidylglycerophosphate synthase